MNIGKACAIFEQIESERYTDEEKLLAIREVIEMPTHNGVTKDTILNAFRWLWNYAIKRRCLCVALCLYIMEQCVR